MAFEDNLQSVNAEAGADLTQYTFASFNASAQLAATGAGAQADGVVQNDPAAAGDSTSLGINGISKVVCGGTVTKGGSVASDASGKAVDATTGDVVVGIALDSGTANAVIPVLLKVQNVGTFA